MICKGTNLWFMLFHWNVSHSPLHDLYNSYQLHHLNHHFHDLNKWWVLDNPRKILRRRHARGAPNISFPRVASPRNFARVRMYFARSTIAIAKIRDYSQSNSAIFQSTVTAGTRTECLAKIRNGMPNGTETFRNFKFLGKRTTSKSWPKFSKWTFWKFPFHLMLYRNFRKFWSNGSRPESLHTDLLPLLA